MSKSVSDSADMLEISRREEISRLGLLTSLKENKTYNYFNQDIDCLNQ